MRFSGTKNSKHSRPSFDMYTTTLITLRDLACSNVYKNGMCPSRLLDLRRYVENNFIMDFGSPASAFVNLMYDSSG